MKKLFLLFTLLLPFGGLAQPLLRNYYTTNQNPSSASSPVNNFYATNLFVTNITAQTITTITNIYNVGQGGKLTITTNFTIVTNASVTISNLARPSILMIGADAQLTNATLSGLTLSGTTLTATGGGGAGVSTAVTALGLSSTNVTGFDTSTNNMTYTLTLAGHYLFGTSTFANLNQNTTNMFFTLGLQQDSTGGWVPKFTNTVVTWSEGVQPVIPTNANSVTYLYFHTHLFTNSMLVGSMNPIVQ
mgnify:CR=1 FL=1